MASSSQGVGAPVEVDGTVRAGVAAIGGDVSAQILQLAPQPQRKGDPQVEASFALGWHIAELWQLQTESRSAPPGGPLPPMGQLSPDENFQLLLSQINSGLKVLGIADSASTASIVGAKQSQGALPTVGSGIDDQAGKSPGGKNTAGGRATNFYLQGPAQAAVRELHLDVLTALMALGFKPGKAYSLGVELSESMLAAYRACKETEDPTSQLSDSFSADRIARLQQQIGDLKTSFQPYAADAVVSTAADFATWIDGLGPSLANKKNPQALSWTSIAQSNLYPQIIAWRSMLSGEKAATDVLTVADYVMALERLVARYWVLARAFVLRWTALFVAIPIIALIMGGLYLLFKGQLSAAYAAVAAAVGLSGISSATVIAAVKNALQKTEDDLWDAELSAAVALAIDYVPVEVPNSRVKALAAPRRKRRS